MVLGAVGDNVFNAAGRAVKLATDYDINQIQKRQAQNNNRNQRRLERVSRPGAFYAHYRQRKPEEETA